MKCPAEHSDLPDGVTATISIERDGETITADFDDKPASEALIAEAITGMASEAMDKDSAGMGKSTRDVLKGFIARVELVEVELADLRYDRTQIYAEAKAFGFDVPIVKRIIKLRKMEEAVREERDALTDLYMDALNGKDKDGKTIDIPLAAAPIKSRERAKHPARIKKDATRTAQLADEKLARDTATKQAEEMSGGGQW